MGPGRISIRELYACGVFFILVGSSAARVCALAALVRNTCYQPCYIGSCPDLTADCVCENVRSWGGGVPSCLVTQCGDGVGQSVFQELSLECITRGGEGGFGDGGGGCEGGTRTQTTSSSTTPAQDPSTSLPASTILPDPVSTSAVRTPDATPDPGHNGAGEENANSDSSDSENSDDQEEESLERGESEKGAPTPESRPTSSSSPADAIPIEDQRPGALESEESKSSATTIALAVSIPIVFVLLMIGAVFFVRRRKLKRSRLSITTFMDKSAAYEPDISGPTNFMQKTTTSPSSPEMPFSFPLPPDMQRNKNVRSPQERPRQHRDLRSNPFADPPSRLPPRTGRTEPSTVKVSEELEPKAQIDRVDASLEYYEPEYMYYPPNALPRPR